MKRIRYFILKNTAYRKDILFLCSVVCGNLVPRDSRTPRTENARALRARLSSFTCFFCFQKGNVYWLLPEYREEIGTKMASSQVSCHWTMSLDRTSAQWIGHHSFGPYTYKLGVDRPTRSLKRFSVSRPLFALRVFLKGAICGVLGEFLVPIFPSYRGV